MKTKKINLFVFLLSLGLTVLGGGCSWATEIYIPGQVPQGDKLVQINEANFPDPTFRAYVSTNFDTGGHHGTLNPAGDGWLGGNELSSVEEIRFSRIFSDRSQVTNDTIQGLQYFMYLNILYLNGCNLSGFAMNLPELTYLRLDWNQNMTALDVTNIPKLQSLYCNDCALEGNLDLSSNTSLTNLTCSDNPKLNVILPKKLMLIMEPMTVSGTFIVPI